MYGPHGGSESLRKLRAEAGSAAGVVLFESVPRGCVPTAEAAGSPAGFYRCAAKAPSRGSAARGDRLPAWADHGARRVALPAPQPADPAIQRPSDLAALL